MTLPPINPNGTHGAYPRRALTDYGTDPEWIRRELDKAERKDKSDE